MSAKPLSPSNLRTVRCEACCETLGIPLSKACLSKTDLDPFLIEHALHGDFTIVYLREVSRPDQPTAYYEETHRLPGYVFLSSEKSSS